MLLATCEVRTNEDWIGGKCIPWHPSTGLPCLASPGDVAQFIKRNAARRTALQGRKLELEVKG